MSRRQEDDAEFEPIRRGEGRGSINAANHGKVKRDLNTTRTRNKKYHSHSKPAKMKSVPKATRRLLDGGDPS